MNAKGCARSSVPAMSRRLAEGESLRVIAKDLGVSPSTVWRHKQRLGFRFVNSVAIPAHDSPEQIKICLACTRPVCPGSCRVIKAAAKLRS